MLSYLPADIPLIVKNPANIVNTNPIIHLKQLFKNPKNLFNFTWLDILPITTNRNDTMNIGYNTLLSIVTTPPVRTATTGWYVLALTTLPIDVSNVKRIGNNSPIWLDIPSTHLVVVTYMFLNTSTITTTTTARHTKWIRSDIALLLSVGLNDWTILPIMAIATIRSIIGIRLVICLNIVDIILDTIVSEPS